MNNKKIKLSLSGFTGENNGPWYLSGQNTENDCFSGNTGIGNYLFQLSACLALCWDNNAELYVPSIKTWCNQDNENINQDDTIWRNINSNDFKSIKLINIPHGYSPNIFKFEQNSEYRGYLQSYKYFDHHKEKIQKTFQPNDTDLNYIYSKYSHLLKLKTCSLHVRRGKDFLKIAEKWNPNFLLKKSYYDKSINYFKNNVDIFLVFTDNLDYCKSLFNLSNYPDIKFHFIRERDFVDLWIMSLCKNYILSNSTFSWWAPYLNKNKCPVIAPKKSVFLEKKNKDYLDSVYYYKDWIILEE